MAKQKGPFRAGEALRGLGEHVGNPERYTVRPTIQSVMEGPIKAQTGMPLEKFMRTTKGKQRQVIDERLIEAVRSFEETSRQLIITPRSIGLAPDRLDVGISHRKDILIMNMSNNVIWIDTSSKVAAPVVGLIGTGLPLAANATPNGYNGARLRGDVNEEVEFWGVAAAGAANLVMVIEAAR